MNNIEGLEKGAMINSKPHIVNSIDELKDKVWDRVVNCITWMRPSWRLHLGHYKWALENWIELEKRDNINNNFLIADYQVLWDHLWETEKMRESVIDMVIDWLSIWLNPEKSKFIVQSYVPEFAELFNLLTMFTSYSIAINNPTLKDELKKIESRWSWKDNTVSLGFVNYPVSQVADIMLLKWTVVPVGEDQIPHIELARKIIKKVNAMCWTNFPIPLALLSENSRLVWTDWSDKMSKSLWNTIYLTATLKEIKKQVNSMYTDPWKTSIQSKWNIENHVVFQYLDIFHKDKDELEDMKNRYISWGENSVWDWEVKKLLIKTLNELIEPIREKREYYKNNLDEVIRSIEDWSKAARKDAVSMIEELKNAMWIMNYWK